MSKPQSKASVIVRLVALLPAITVFLSTSVTAAPKLAIIVEDHRLSQAADLLTVQLSTNLQIQLLEREQINRILKEQSLTARIGTDFVKVGETLGADGLLMLDVVERENRPVISARLSAVKPGVVLDIVEYPFTATEIGQSVTLLRERFEPFFPKLGVLVKDAVPISMLNMRSAVKTTSGEALERELSIVLSSRLIHQPEIFLLERQKLRALAEEKNFKGLGEEPFWNGSYLLEGTIDKAGYREGKITLSARLTPPGKKPPIDFEVTGARKEALSLTHELATKILDWLKVQSSSRDWNAQDEAKRYFQEAKWAWNWKMLPEALAASDAAWALGLQDMECATIRVSSAACIATHALPMEMSLQPRNRFSSKPQPWPPFLPDAKDVEMAARALSAYEELSQALAVEEPKYDSPWYRLGVETLTRTSKLLQVLHVETQSQPAVREQSAALRARARSVAGWISRSPSVRAKFWRDPGDPGQYQGGLLMESQDLLRCQIDYGILWQDRPEDCLELYRDLIPSTALIALHPRLCSPYYMYPRLSGWTDEDRARIPRVWAGFVRELVASTNALWHIEGRLLEYASTERDEQRKQMVEAILNELLATNAAPSTNSDAGPFALSPQLVGYLTQPFAEISSEYQRRLQPLQQSFWLQNQKEFLRNNTPFEFVSFSQIFRFRDYSAAQAQELQPLVTAYKSNLLAAAQESKRGEWVQYQGAISQLSFVENAIRRALGLAPVAPAFIRPPTNAIARTPPERPPAMRTNLPQTSRTTVPMVTMPVKSPSPTEKIDTNNRPNWVTQPRPARPTREMRLAEEQRAEALLTTARFVKLPQQLFKTAPGPRRLVIEGHRVHEGKVWFDVRYGWDTEWHGAAAIWDGQSFRRELPATAAGLTNGWQIIHYPIQDTAWAEAFSRGPEEAQSGVHFELFKGALYLSVWHEAIRRLILSSNAWQRLPIPVDKPTQLFALGDHLYAANDESIYEIVDDGQRTRLLASCRRRPAASVLDNFESLGRPILFTGPKGTLRACIGDKIVLWNGADWSAVTSLRGIAPPTVFEDASVFRSKGPPTANFWRLTKDANNAELCWQEPWPLQRPGLPDLPGEAPSDHGGPAPAWQAVPNLKLATAGVLSAGSKLYLFAPHFDLAGRQDSEADLVCLERGTPRPWSVPVQLPPGFSFPRGWLHQPVFPWMSSFGDLLLIGQPSAKGVMVLSWKDVEKGFAAAKGRPATQP